MGIFPNFSPQVFQPSSFPPKNVANPPTTQHTPFPSKTILKKPNNRVSFNLSPGSCSSPSPSSIATPCSANYPNFIRSHILNPSSNAPQHPQLTASPSFLDPLLPPTVKLTKQFSDSGDDGRYVLSRLRDRRIYENVRLYLAYLHDKPDSICIDGITKTNVMVSIQQEGLPTDPDELKDIFVRFHDSFNISPINVANDLSSFASHVSSKRLSHLQRTRTNFKNYFRS